MNHTSTHRILSCSLLWWLNTSCLIFAQPHDIRFGRISVEHGLSNFSISDIMQDQQGFLWITTEEGLNKYDGYDFTVYRADLTDSTALPSSFLGQLYLDRAGNLWINAGGRLLRYNPAADSFERFDRIYPNTAILAGESVTRILEDRHGEFWIGTGEGLYRYDPRTQALTFYRHDPNDPTSISDNHVVYMVEDRSGVLWIGTLQGGVNRFDRETNVFTSYRYDPANHHGLASNFVVCIYEDRRGVLWIGTENGLCRYDRQADRVRRYQPTPEAARTLGSDRVFSLFEDSQGTLWAGTRNLGLWRYEPETDSFYNYQHDPNDPYSLSANRIHAIYEDRSGVLWFGHYRAGLSRYAHRQDKFVRHKTNSEIYAICEDRNAHLWVGGIGTGLMQYDRDGALITHYRHDPQNPRSLSSNDLWAICEDRLGHLWIGTREGLNFFDTRRRVFFRYPHQALDPNNAEHREVKTIFEDSTGDLWLGTKGSGLLRLDRNTQSFIYYQPEANNPHSLSGEQVWAIREDQNRDLWLGTFGAGLNRFDRTTGTFMRYPHNVDNQSPDASHSVIYSVHPDTTGAVWLGTFGGGLQRLDLHTNRFTRYMDRDGLVDNFVKGIMPDKKGNLWLSTDKGLSRFDPHTATFKNYQMQDGLISNVLLSGAYAKGRDGRFYFGGEGGFIAFYPDSIKGNPIAPPVAITRFKIFDKPLQRSISVLQEIKLSHRQNFFSFEFVALDYTDPARNQYAHKLEGVDPDWVYAGTRRYASYTNVDPGEYVFRVKAANSDGVWNETGAAIRILVAPPFWKTWWFRALAATIVIAAAWGIYRYRVNHLLELERLRTRIAADLHDEIAGNLSSIAMFGKIVQDEAATAGETTSARSQLLERIIALSQDSVVSIREIIWAIDPKSETMHDLLLRVHDLVVNACRTQNMALRFVAPPKEQLPATNLSPEQRKHLWLLLKEAIINAVKHSHATELSVRARYKSGKMKITIADNGRGIDGAAGSRRFSGKGLGTMKSRAEQLGGSLEIISSPEKGTTINAVVKI